MPRGADNGSCGRTIWHVERTYLGGQALSEFEVDVAVASLRSPVSDERLLASEILLQTKTKHSFREAALQVAQHEFENQEASQEPCQLQHTLILLAIPIEQLCREGVFRKAAYASAHALDIEVRTNAGLVLWRLGQRGDGRAVALLKALREDPHKKVRHNAHYWLEKLGETLT